MQQPPLQQEALGELHQRLQNTSGAFEMLTADYGNLDQSTGYCRLTLVAGLHVYYLPEIRFASPESRAGLEGSLRFVVQPLLPLGLTLDASTGGICGVPQQGVENSSHIVIVKTVALGPGGLTLGEVPVAGCLLRLNILDASQLTLTNHRVGTGQVRNLAGMLLNGPNDSDLTVSFRIGSSMSQHTGNF